MPSQTMGDVEMGDTTLNGGVTDEFDPTDGGALPRDDDTRLKLLPGDVPGAASFEFTNEDHTLGNALRYIIMKNPKVEFCGYSIPHPSDPKMNIRIQTYDNESVFDVLEQGLKDLMEMLDVVEEKFIIARDNFPKSTTGQAS